MGGITQTGTDSWAAWTGGKPKADWSGFAVATVDFETPNQMRPIYDVKGYNHRKGGLTDKFNKTDMFCGVEICKSFLQSSSLKAYNFGKHYL